MSPGSEEEARIDLHYGEPEGGPWTPIDPTRLLDLLVAGAPTPPGRPRVVAFDGRGGSGKSTLTDDLAAAAAVRGLGAAVVRTDDAAWHHSFFEWDQVTVDGVLEPVHAGKGTGFSPDAWIRRGRDGSVRVSPDADLVLMEGTGSVRRSLEPWLDRTVWIQVDRRVATARLSAREGDDGDTGTFRAEWVAVEEPFLLAERPWDHADLVLLSGADGTMFRGARRAG